MSFAQKLLRVLTLPATAALVWWAVVLLIALLFVSWKLPADPDLFWHIRAGHDILAQGVPHVDWYSFTMPDFPWVNHEYAQDVFMAWLYDLGGFRLLSIVYALVVVVGLTLGLRWLLKTKTSAEGWLLALVSALGIVLLSRSFIGTRPQMWSYVFVLVVLGLLRRARDPERSDRIIWWLPVVFAAWANWHGSFAIGLASIAIVVVAEIAKKWVPGLPGSRLGWSRIGRLALVFVASGLATLVTPYGVDVWVEVIRTVGDPELHRNIVEWFSPSVRDRNGPVLFGAALAAGAALALRRKRTDTSDVGVGLAYWWTALLAVRNVPLFLLVAVPLVAQTLHELIGTWVVRIGKTWLVLAVATAGVVLISFSVPVRALWSVDQSTEWLTSNKYPVGAATYLQEHPDIAERHLFHPYAWGGYLLLEVPGFESVIDGRMPSWEADGQKVIKDFFIIDRLEVDWPDVLERYGVTGMVLPPDHDLVGAAQKTAGYSEVFRDDQAVILIKPL